MTDVISFWVAVVDIWNYDTPPPPQEITEARKSAFCQRGRLGDCSWTVTQSDTAERGTKNNIVKWAHKALVWEVKDKSTFQTEWKKYKSLWEFQDTFLNQSVQTVWNEGSLCNNGHIRNCNNCLSFPLLIYAENMTSNGLVLIRAIYFILMHCCEVVRKVDIDMARGKIAMSKMLPSHYLYSIYISW